MTFFLGSALLGVEYALLAVGVYITFRILNVPDLTVDGSFALGVVLSSVAVAAGHPFLALRYNILSANALKLLSAVIVGITLSVPAIKAALEDRKIRKEAAANADS